VPSLVLNRARQHNFVTHFKHTFFINITYRLEDDDDVPMLF